MAWRRGRIPLIAEILLLRGTRLHRPIAER